VISISDIAVIIEISLDEVEGAVVSSASVQVLPEAQGYCTVLVEGYNFVEGRVIFNMVCNFAVVQVLEEFCISCTGSF
jgi:hypothetical protein